MSKMLIGIVFFLAVMALGYYLLQPESRPIVADFRDTDQVAQGRVLYQESCASCHGGKLEGETPDWRSQKADGTLPAPPHDGDGHTWHHGDKLLFDYIKFGGQAIVPSDFKSAMPAFSDRHSDAEIMSILAFIKSSWSPQQQAHQARASAQERP